MKRLGKSEANSALTCTSTDIKVKRYHKDIYPYKIKENINLKDTCVLLCTGLSEGGSGAGCSPSCSFCPAPSSYSLYSSPLPRGGPCAAKILLQNENILVSKPPLHFTFDIISEYQECGWFFHSKSLEESKYVSSRSYAIVSFCPIPPVFWRGIPNNLFWFDQNNFPNHD